MKTVVSGIRPTGKLHIGNYFGAVKNFVKMQHEYKCYFFIADYHSLTTHPNPEDLHTHVKDILVEYLACGIDPEAATIYIQSDLPETIELYLLLNMLAYKGELERCASFKEKIREQQHNINAGILTYPVLMAADILIHKANMVPVGKDQEQHLEMTRNYAKRFNHIYKSDFFPEPTAFNYDEQLIKIPGLDGSGKMGKSTGNALFLSEDPASLRKKVMKAVTDSGPTKNNQHMSEEISNIFLLLKAVSAPDVIKHFEDQYNNCTIRYGEMKKQLAEDIVQFTEPIRERIKEISSDKNFIKKTVKFGAEKARHSAKETIKMVKEIIGIRKLY